MINYTQRIRKYEEKLYEVLMIIKDRPATLIGKKSLTLLFQFINGYEYAFIDLLEYRLHFEKEFQSYISNRYMITRTLNWCTFLLEQRTEEEAYDAFYDELVTFLDLVDNTPDTGFPTVTPE